MSARDKQVHYVTEWLDYAEENSILMDDTSPDLDKPPHTELASDFFCLIGAALFVALICAAAGLAWGLLLRFAPGVVLMLQHIFSSIL